MKFLREFNLANLGQSCKDFFTQKFLLSSYNFDIAQFDKNFNLVVGIA